MLGQAYITWPLLPEGFRTIDKIKVIAERLNIIGAQVKKAGLIRANQRRLTCLSLFWHFLDLVWIGVFTFVYLMGVLP